MTQNIYDDQTSFGHTLNCHGQLGIGRCTGVPGAARLPPDLNGLEVLDLGCGYGWFCRWAAPRAPLGCQVSTYRADVGAGALDAKRPGNYLCPRGPGDDQAEAKGL